MYNPIHSVSLVSSLNGNESFNYAYQRIHGSCQCFSTQPTGGNSKLNLLCDIDLPDVSDPYVDVACILLEEVISCTENSSNVRFIASMYQYVLADANSACSNPKLWPKDLFPLLQLGARISIHLLPQNRMIVDELLSNGIILCNS